MGFFRKMASALISVGEKILDTHGKVLEKIGEITHIAPIEDLGMNIQCFNPLSSLRDRIDVTDSNTSVQDTIDVHMACEKARLETEKQAQAMEDTCIESIEADINKFKDSLAEVIPEDIIRRFDYSLGKGFTDEIHSTVSGYVSGKISQDNEEFVRILNLEAEVRKEKSEEYMKKVLAEASKELQNKCQQKKITLYRSMYNNLEEYFVNQRKIGEEQERNYRELQEHENDMAYQEKHAAKVVIDIAHMECIRTLTYANS